MDSVIDLEGELISKPENRNNAEILKKLNGKTSFNKFCLYFKNGVMIWNYTDKAKLTMKNFTENQLKNTYQK